MASYDPRRKSEPSGLFGRRPGAVDPRYVGTVRDPRVAAQHPKGNPTTDPNRLIRRPGFEDPRNVGSAPNPRQQDPYPKGNPRSASDIAKAKMEASRTRSPGVRRPADLSSPNQPGKRDPNASDHADFTRTPGASTQAIVRWRNKDTGEVYNARDGGYAPREGTAWELDRNTVSPPSGPSTTDKAKEALAKAKTFMHKKSGSSSAGYSDFLNRRGAQYAAQRQKNVEMEAARRQPGFTTTRTVRVR